MALPESFYLLFEVSNTSYHSISSSDCTQICSGNRFWLLSGPDFTNLLHPSISSNLLFANVKFNYLQTLQILANEFTTSLYRLEMSLFYRIKSDVSYVSPEVERWIQIKTQALICVLSVSYILSSSHFTHLLSCLLCLSRSAFVLRTVTYFQTPDYYLLHLVSDYIAYFYCCSLLYILVCLCSIYGIIFSWFSWVFCNHWLAIGVSKSKYMFVYAALYRLLHWNIPILNFCACLIHMCI